MNGGLDSLAHPVGGPIALVGSGEFLPAMEKTDKELLRLAGGWRPRVAVLPTAAGREVPAAWAERGVAHFQRLGAEALAAMVVDRATANDPGAVAPLERARLIYLSGGDPRYLLETLRDTLACHVVLRRWARGVLLAGCSAGAMVLGTWCFLGGEVCCEGPLLWGRGLGLLPRLAILPHFDTVPPARRRALLGSLPLGAVALGIDERTTVALTGPSWRVVAGSRVTVMTREGSRAFRPGELFALPPPRPTPLFSFGRPPPLDGE